MNYEPCFSTEHTTESRITTVPHRQQSQRLLPPNVVAQGLSAAAIQQLGAELLDELSSESTEDIAKAWADEAVRRGDEAPASGDRGEPWEVVRARLVACSA